MLNTVFENPWVRAAALVAVVVAVAMLGLFLRPVLVPLFLAFIVAYVLHPVVTMLEKRRIPRAAGVALIVAVGILAVAALPLWLVPSVVHESEAFIKESRAQAHPGDWYEWLDARLPLEEWVRMAGWVPEDAEEVDVRQVLTVKIGTFLRTNVVKLLQTAQQTLLPVATTLASLGRTLLALLFFLGNLAVFAFVAGYLLKDFDRLLGSIRGLIPLSWRPKALDLAHKIDLQLRSFLRGQLLVCAALAVMYVIGLLICDVPFAVLIGLFGGVASIVPYLGITLTIGPAVILTLLQHGLDWHVLGVAATFVAAQMIESTILTPKIVGESVGLNPVWVILAIMVFSSAFGFLGLLMAVPVAAVLKVLVMEALTYYRRSSLYAEGV
jgi:predicted PurR-regulated permease PerM